MLNLLKLSPADRKDLFQITARSLSVDAAIIEKDFWVVVVLMALFGKSAPSPFIFKGGTSLSKAFQLINRFSEDIDITIDRTILGFKQSNEEISTLSRKSRDKLLKEMQETSCQFVSQNLRMFLQEELSKFVTEPFEIKPVESDLQSLRFYYPTIETQNSYVAQSVYIECGIRGCMEPSEEAHIKPYAAEFLNSESIQVQVLSPLRTFWEKATLLHAEFNRPSDKTTPLRLSRHFYDLYMFSNSPYWERALGNVDLLKDVIQHKNLLFPSSWSNYMAILETGIQLTPPINMVTLICLQLIVIFIT